MIQLVNLPCFQNIWKTMSLETLETFLLETFCEVLDDIKINIQFSCFMQLLKFIQNYSVQIDSNSDKLMIVKHFDCVLTPLCDLLVLCFFARVLVGIV